MRASVENLTDVTERKRRFDVFNSFSSPVTVTVFHVQVQQQRNETHCRNDIFKDRAQRTIHFEFDLSLIDRSIFTTELVFSNLDRLRSNDQV